MDYSKMSTEELLELKDELENEISALDNKQLALKILMNSAYGAMASPYFRYFDIRLAKSVTMSGQLSIKWLYLRLEKYLIDKFKLKESPYQYSDTDSVYFCLDFIKARTTKTEFLEPSKMVDYVDKFSKTIIEPKITSIYEQLAKYMNANTNKMVMKQEKISEKFLQTGKKRYAALVWDDEGVRYDKPVLKVTGIEIVRSSTPKIIKPYLKGFINELMYNPDNIYNYVSDVKEKFKLMEPEQISFPRTVSEVNKYTDRDGNFKSKCPIGVRAAIIFNKYIEKHDIEMDKVADGEKIKFFYALTPNCFFNENVFGYVNRIPNKEEVAKYVDYNVQFNKVFFDVVKGISEKVGYPLEKVKQTNLENLF